MESFTQFLYVGFIEVTFLVQDFRHATFRAENWDQVLLAESIGVHQCANHLHRRRVRNGMMFFFVCFDQGQQDFSILLFFARWRIGSLCQHRLFRHSRVAIVVVLSTRVAEQRSVRGDVFRGGLLERIPTLYLRGEHRRWSAWCVALFLASRKPWKTVTTLGVCRGSLYPYADIINGRYSWIGRTANGSH